MFVENFNLILILSIVCSIVFFLRKKQKNYPKNFEILKNYPFLKKYNIIDAYNNHLNNKEINNFNLSKIPEIKNYYCLIKCIINDFQYILNKYKIENEEPFWKSIITGLIIIEKIPKKEENLKYFLIEATESLNIFLKTLEQQNSPKIKNVKKINFDYDTKKMILQIEKTLRELI